MRQQEAKATNAGVQWVSHARDVLTAMGDAPEGPTFVGSDNLANVLVGSTWGTARTSRHFIRTYFTIIQRVTAGEIEIGHVKDAENPSDFLTKWTGQAKLSQSLEFLTNQRAWDAARARA